MIIAPYVLGYIFNDSLVVFLMSKNRCRGALRIAVDATVLQQNVYSEECIRIYRDIAESIADMVRELKQIDSIAFLLYSSIPITDPKLLPGHTLIACCEREIHSQNKKVLDSVYVTETSWCSYTASENTPFGGNLLQELETSPTSLECKALMDAPIESFKFLRALPHIREERTQKIAKLCKGFLQNHHEDSAPQNLRKKIRQEQKKEGEIWEKAEKIGKKTSPNNTQKHKKENCERKQDERKTFGTEQSKNTIFENGQNKSTLWASEHNEQGTAYESEQSGSTRAAEHELAHSLQQPTPAECAKKLHEIEELFSHWNIFLNEEERKISTTTLAYLICALQSEEHWMHLALALIYSPKDIHDHSRKLLRTHQKTVWDFMMTAPNNTLYPEPIRVEASAMMLETMRERVKRVKNLRSLLQKLAILSAHAPVHLRENVEAFRAYCWGCNDNLSLAKEIIRPFPSEQQTAAQQQILHITHRFLALLSDAALRKSMFTP